MKKWAQQIESQRRRYRGGGPSSARGSGESRSGGGPVSILTGTSATEFEFMRNQPMMENPYAMQFAEDEEEEEEEEEDDVDTLVATSGSAQGGAYGLYKQGSAEGFAASSRNGSSTSLRSRSTTGESAVGRAPHPRFPSGSMAQQPQPNLSLRTRELRDEAAVSPLNGGGLDSYFSPSADSPSQMSLSGSSRTSASSTAGMYPFPRQNSGMQGQNGGYGNSFYEEGPPRGHAPGTSARFTAPAIARQRESGNSGPHGQQGNGYAGRGPQRPGMGMGGMHSSVQMPGQPRNRSVSSPDIHNNPPGGRGRGGGGVPAVPDMPAPYQYQNAAANPPHMVPRSQSNSPQLGMGMPARGSPQMHRGQGQQRGDPPPTSYYNGGPPQMRYPPQQQQPNSRNTTPVPPQPPSLQHQQSAPPTLPTTAIDTPTQLKVKVHCPSASQMLTLVVPLNISYQSLKDRIDAKLQRSTNLSLGERGPKDGQVKLKYLDDEDYVSIQSDEDVLTAFETWREQQPQGDAGGGGTMGEIELFCQR